MAALLAVPAAGLGAAVGAARWLRPRTPRVGLAVGLLVGAPLGAGAVRAQRGPDPATRPVAVALPPAPTRLSAGPPPARVDLAPGVTVLSREAVRVALPGGGAAVARPLLAFTSCSPDRAWTVFAPRGAFRPPARRAVGWRRDGARLRVAFGGGPGPSRLAVAADGSAAEVEAWTALPDAVYAHLAAVVQVELTRVPPPIEVVFAPCPTPIEVRYADYPTGRPARIACLGDDGALRVLEAASGEKGPFRELARGPLARGEPLVAEVRGAGRPVLRLTLRDWSAQAATAPSPTAGWGLPQNAIELRRTGPRSAFVYVTLADTAVGRGWDSVGHAAGAYRTRLRLDPLGQ